MALSQDVLLEELRKLMTQRESGALSGEDFERYAAALLSGSASPMDMPPPQTGLEDHPQATVDRPPQRRTPAWTATPTAVPTVAATPPRAADSTVAPPLSSVPETPSTSSNRASGTARSAVPGLSTTANHSTAGSNLWSAAPGPGTAASRPDPERPARESVAGPPSARNGWERKSSWAAKPEAPTEEPQRPPSRESGRRLLRRAVDPYSRLSSDHPTTTPSPRAKTESEPCAPEAAGGPDLRASEGATGDRSTTAFAAVPTTAPAPARVVENGARRNGNGKGRLLRRSSRSVSRSEPIAAETQQTAAMTLRPDAAGSALSDVTRGTVSAPAGTQLTDGRGQHLRSKERPSFTATPNAELSAESAEADEEPATGSTVESDTAAAEDNAPTAQETINEMAVLERTRSDPLDGTNMAEVFEDIEQSIEPPAPPQNASPRGRPAASSWVFQPERLVESPAPMGEEETTTAEVDVAAGPPVTPRAPRGHKKTGKHSQQKKRHDKHVATVVEEVSPRAEAPADALELDEGPLPASYWDLSRRILPEVRPVGDDDGTPGIAPFSYWDLSNRVLAPAPESDGEAQLDPEGYWSRSIKE